MKVMAAMSGGVDSAAAALLLMAQGFEVEGVTMVLDGTAEAEAAQALCARLGLRHHVVDLCSQFAEQVIDPFGQQYLAGLTPNPCVACNRSIKFGALMDWALAAGADRFATGHYARVEQDIPGHFALKKAADPKKDQSYVLYTLSQARLARTLLPLGGLSKSDARAVTRQHGLEVASRPESQDICFIPDGDYAGYIARRTGTPSPAGDFVLADGTVIGRHRGLVHYTVGQRKGLGIAWPHPLYVLAKDSARNAVVLGSEDQVQCTCFTVSDTHWIDGPPGRPLRAWVRTRYHQRETPAAVTPLPDGRARISCDAPVRAPAPGQAAVFYDGDTVLGGGIIERLDTITETE